jgi:predicted dehydrogenase
LSQDTIHVAVIGAGAFGRNHARVYHELGQQDSSIKLAAVVDSNLPRASAVAGEYDARPYSSLDELIRHENINAASVAVPTVDHRDMASRLMEAGIDVLIEKPVASNLAEADELVALAHRARRIGQVGHLERFNPAVRATLPLITHPMFFEVHRLSVFTPRSLDVDVVLDLMIHDLDVILAFVNSPVKEIRAVGLPILSGKVDIANVRMEFDSGCVANLTASRVSTERVRKLRFFQPGQYISIDYGRQDVIVFSVGGTRDPSATPSVNPKISMGKPAVVAEEPLHAELKSFLDCVRERTRPLVSLEDGRRALSVALEIVSAIAAHSQEIQLERLQKS